MQSLATEYLALKTADYLRDVVAQQSMRQERLLTELTHSRDPTETTTVARPRVWARPVSAVRSAVAAAEHGIVARMTRRSAQPAAQ